ncbi:MULTISPECIES: DUF1294 domain-containing protein [unclassified Ruegeria]|uniref:DUF1294 domain-containing protein n=1 Tax=unclassified Ruegeria TaxID=2625375 RepID=UPI001FFDFCB3|nr:MULTISPECIES: DUF1294 domain-containing protein [unclassified Ruegeria]
MKKPSVFSLGSRGHVRYRSRMWIAVMYLWAINTLTLLAFGWDKLRARRRKRRVPERRLLWLAALGGSPGAIVGRWIFRHKTRKRGFSRWLFAILIGQAAACYAAFTFLPPLLG